MISFQMGYKNKVDIQESTLDVDNELNLLAQDRVDLAPIHNRAIRQ